LSVGEASARGSVTALMVIDDDGDGCSTTISMSECMHC